MSKSIRIASRVVPKTPEIRPGTIMEHAKAAMGHSKAAKELPRTIWGMPGAPRDYPQSVLGAPRESPRARWDARKGAWEHPETF